MGDELIVLMGDRVAGALTRGANNLLRFEYEPAYRSAADATPLSLSMPLDVPLHRDVPSSRVVTNFLQGLLPDDDGTIRRWAAAFQVRMTSPYFLLGTPVGRDCAGAVSFCPEDDLAAFRERGGSVEPLTEEDVADLLRQIRQDRTSVLGRDLSGQFSLAGAQAKIALRQDADGHWGRPRGTEPTNRILKPASAGWRDQDINEHVCLAAAGILGLAVARSGIHRFGDQEAIVSFRFDRAPAGDMLRRIHQEDMCQAAGLGPDRKYETHGGPSVRSIGALLRRSMPAGDADAAVARFADGLIWNWIIAGTDAHAKNYSVLLAGRAVRLAPLYDVASMLPYLGDRSPVDDNMLHERDMRSAMKLGGHYELHPIRDPWARVAADLGLSGEILRERASHLASNAADALSTAVTALPPGALDSPIADRLVSRVAERAAACERVMGRASAE